MSSKTKLAGPPDARKNAISSVHGCGRPQSTKGLCQRHNKTRASSTIKRKRMQNKRTGHIPA